MSFNIFAQESAAKMQTYKIVGISVEGNKTADQIAIIANSGLKINEEISIPSEQTRNAIARIWALRIFSDVQIIAERVLGSDVYILIKVSEHPRLGKIIFNGYDALSESDFNKKITALKGQILSPQEINKTIKQISKAYEEEGYLQAKIISKLIPSSDSTLKDYFDLQINISEGSEVKISEIKFEGIDDFDPSDLKSAMQDTHEKVWWKFWQSNKFEKKKYTDDKKKVIQFLKKKGYREAEIISDSIKYDDKKENLTLVLYLHKGPQYRVRNITWDGNTIFPTSLLDLRLDFNKGDLYDFEKFEQNLRGNQDQTDVASLYLDNGYLTVMMDPLEKKLDGDSIDVQITIRERNQFRVGKVEIRGNSKTDEKVIRRELRIRPGDYFSRSDIIRSIRQLSVLNYFNPEKIKPDTRFVSDSTVDVIVDVEEKSSDTFNMSVGYSEFYGATGMIGLTFNNFSIDEPLKGGGGQVFNIDWQFGELNRYQTFSISFREPWMFDTPTSLGFSVFDTKQNYYYNLRQTGGTVSIGKQFRWPDDYFRGDWIFRAQQIDVKEVAYLYDRSGKSSQFSLTQVISRNSINNPLFPSDGSNISLNMELSGPPLLGGNTEYLKSLLNIDWYAPIANNHRFALYMGSEFGVISKYRNSSYIPPIEYFFMGGTGISYIATTPLRGYEERTVGPQDPTSPTRVLPGTVMAKQTLEIRFNVALNPIPIYILAFAEAGNVWDGIANTSFYNVKRSAGIGARLQINPIGLVGFDYGYGFDKVLDNTGPSGWRFHFQFGRGF
ncbi:MAG: outer membrane protein assembly factor BamA [Bacteroidetes bacterium]|nr:outer membrane protein assembly factor BamA [Bacteroidota bacterium]